MRKYQSLLLCIILAVCSRSLFADNPIIKNIGMSDPHVKVINETIYLFTGHDETPHDKVWDMRYWMVYSSTDLVNWNKETIIAPTSNYMKDNSKDCWAGDVAERNGNYYFYFSDRNRSVGVMKSSTAGGDYVDPLGHSLIEPGHDPTIFIDDNKKKTPYLVYGSNEIGGFHVAKLNKDMISLAEEPKLITISGEAWNKAPKWQDKNYIFKNNGTYYLSWGRDYAISENIYGPYTSIGAVGEGYKLSEFAHGSFFWWKGQFYHVWCYYIVDGLKYRESIITYCHFNKEGNIVTDTRFLDEHFENGVGQYNANWERIEGEWYYGVSNDVKKIDLSEDNFAVSIPKDRSWIQFAKVNFADTKKIISAHVRCESEGELEVRSNSPEGTLLGSISISNTEGRFETFSAEISEISGVKDLYIAYKTKSKKPVDMDWISFK